MPKKTRKAAYFLLTHQYYGRPLDEGVVRALLSAGYEIDMFASALPEVDNIYPPTVRFLVVQYRLGWLRQNLNPIHWRKYDLFLGTSDLPMAVVGLLGALTGRKNVTICDEIYVGGYEGNARSLWKRLAQFGMRRSTFTVITDLCRIPLQQEYAGLTKDHQFVQFPCCFPDNKFIYDKKYWRNKLGIADDTCVISIAGETANGAHLAINALVDLPSRFRLLIQPGGSSIDKFTHATLQLLARDGRIVYVPGRSPSYIEAMSLSQAVDIGLVFYLSEKAQFKEMGVSSNKLCMYLQMGKPVIATRQDSFKFLEEFNAGILVNDEKELANAIEIIADDYERYCQSALKCFLNYIQPEKHLQKMIQQFESI